jgi:hypothetical protein
MPDGQGTNSTGIAVPDWNGDGQPDLLVSRELYRIEGSKPQVLEHKIWLHLRKQ